MSNIITVRGIHLLNAMVNAENKLIGVAKTDDPHTLAGLDMLEKHGLAINWEGDPATMFKGTDANQKLDKIYCATGTGIYVYELVQAALSALIGQIKNASAAQPAGEVQENGDVVDLMKDKELQTDDETLEAGGET